MDSTDSEYSVGGESGWTLYLDNTCISNQNEHFGARKDDEEEAEEEEEEEEEDLSMVSDASSGPRYCFGEDEELFNEKTSKKNKNKIKEQYSGIHWQHTCLDDTASSPVKGFSRKNPGVSGNEASAQQVLVGFSQGCSAAKLKGKSGVRKHLGFSQPSGKQASEDQGRKKRG